MYINLLFIVHPYFFFLHFSSWGFGVLGFWGFGVGVRGWGLVEETGPADLLEGPQSLLWWG